MIFVVFSNQHNSVILWFHETGEEEMEWNESSFMFLRAEKAVLHLKLDPERKKEVHRISYKFHGYSELFDPCLLPLP